ncbi:MAG: SdiA-regulated domain-containing protein [Ignavibacteriales bacterium]|nr:SdiA-regulated domain-containing protein [Ignavibacteriales bacterium]
MKKRKNLTFSIAEKIPVTEPSGLDLTFDEKGFWIVSDQNSKVYLIDSWGRVVKSFKVDGEDLEGITVIDDSTLAVVLERTREVVILDTSGLELKRRKLNLKGELNSWPGGNNLRSDREKVLHIE